MKKLIIFTFALLLLSFVFLSPVNASTRTNLHDYESHESNVTSKGGDFGVLYIPCPSGGKHVMAPRGKGNVYVNGVDVLRGDSSQCTKCMDVIVSQFSPWANGATKLGKYASQAFGNKIGTTVKLLNIDKLRTNTSLKASPFDGYTWNIHLK
ncbi:hypothetical protein [Planococcus sp. S3-L1]|uniref:hypothetical protein n=1 Tax=Planococcus sp. S3-L1 TaxID=3046200 RepID=UPI0024BB4E23|nr:hypothetical protein [Planococcus sp. S3-L1]MDJ0333537.1 hypothetical protein [Planococcus sp. S3-L1]